MFTEREQEEILNFLLNHNGNIIIGGDSQKFKRNDQWYARYTVVVIVHIENGKGGKIFHFSDIEPVYDVKNSKPRMRLMREVQKVVDTYTELLPLFEDRHVEIHLDLNNDEKYASNIVVKEALGYVQGCTGIEAKIKPSAWGASHASDHFVRGKHTKEIEKH